MRELKNGIKIIGTDLGYGNCKGANTVLPSGIITSVMIQSLYFKGTFLSTIINTTAWERDIRRFLRISLWTMISIS